MATPTQATFIAKAAPQSAQLQHQQNIAIIKEKLKELGPGPYTPDQQKIRDSYLLYLSKDNITSGSQATAGQPVIHISSDGSGQQQATTGQQPGSSAASNQQNQILDKRALQELVKEVDPTEQLDEDVEDMLLQIADDFIENVINSSCQLAKHRKSNVLEAKDVQFHLERNYNIWIPGFSTDELKTYKKSVATEAHKQRLQLIKKSTSKPGDAKGNN